MALLTNIGSIGMIWIWSRRALQAKFFGTDLRTYIPYFSVFFGFVVKKCCQKLFFFLGTKKNRRQILAIQRLFLASRSDGIRTHGLLVPNQARYQLRYTPIRKPQQQALLRCGWG